MKKMFIFGFVIFNICGFVFGGSGEINDYIESEFENLYPPHVLSDMTYDAHKDSDGDGWSNYAEARYSSMISNSCPNSFDEYPIPELNIKFKYFGENFGEQVIVHAYKNPNSYVYGIKDVYVDRSSMNGVPDAIFKAVLTEQKQCFSVRFTHPYKGRLVEGPHALFAFFDLNQNETWDAGEPCGVLPYKGHSYCFCKPPFRLNVGWYRNTVEMEISDSHKDYFRFDFKAGLRTEDVLFGNEPDSVVIPDNLKRFRVKMRDVTSFPNILILDKTLEHRDYIHEGDFFDIAGFNYKAKNGNAINALFEVYVGAEDSDFSDFQLVYTFTNTPSSWNGGEEYPSPTIIGPKNFEKVYSAGPTFKWKMHEDFLFFHLEVRRGSSSGPIVLTYYGRPTKDDRKGLYKFVSESFFAESWGPSDHKFHSNTNYFFRIGGINSRNFEDSFIDTTPVWSDWQNFVLATDTGSTNQTDYCVVPFLLSYNVLLAAPWGYPPIFKIEVYDTPDFSGRVVCEKRVDPDDYVPFFQASNDVPINIIGLAPNSLDNPYYFVYYFDCSQNNKRNIWVPWDYANYVDTNLVLNSSIKNADTSVYRKLYGKMHAPYDPKPFVFESGVQSETNIIHIHFPDVDNDGVFDWDEYMNSPGGDFLNYNDELDD